MITRGCGIDKCAEDAPYEMHIDVPGFRVDSGRCGRHAREDRAILAKLVAERGPWSPDEMSIRTVVEEAYYMTAELVGALPQEQVEQILALLRHNLENSLETEVHLDADVQELRPEVILARGGDPGVAQYASVATTYTIRTVSKEQLIRLGETTGRRLVR